MPMVRRDSSWDDFEKQYGSSEMLDRHDDYSAFVNFFDGSQASVHIDDLEVFLHGRDVWMSMKDAFALKRIRRGDKLASGYRPWSQV